MVRLRLIAGVIALVGLVGWVWVVSPSNAQQHGGVVSGKVTNATPDGGSLFGAIVVLHQHGATTRNDLTITADAHGRFRFDDILFDPNLTYAVSVEYQGVPYGMDIDLTSGFPADVSLTVYDAMDDESVISASLASVMFASADTSAQTVSVLELIKIVNNSNYSYVPGPEPMNLLRFGLPPGTRDLEVDTSLLGADFVQVDSGFSLLTGVPPGQHDVMYTYQSPYSGSQMAFTKRLIYGAEQLRVLAPYEVLELSSQQLGHPEAITIGQREYQLLQFEGLPRGGTVSIDLGGLPEPSMRQRLGLTLDDFPFEYTVPVCLGLFMVFLIGYALWRQSNEGRDYTLGTSGVSSVEDDLRTIKEMTLDLERSFHDGSLSEGDYRRRLAVLRKRLVSLMKP